MSNNSLKPVLRFKGFTNAWELHDLWSLTIWDKKFNEVDKEKQSKVIKYPYVLADKLNSLEDLNGDVLLMSTGAYQAFTTESKAGSNLCEGEVVAIPWGGTPNIKYWSGKFVTADNRIATSNNINILKNKYLYYWFNSNSKLLDSFYRGASIKHPSMDDVLNMKILVPSIKEQELIINKLTHMDYLITLHQRKYDRLVEVKKSLLQTLFPRDGESVPKIRFKGFTNAWELHKLGDIGTTYTGLSGKSANDFGHGDGRFVTYMNVFTNPISNDKMLASIEIDNKQNSVKFGDVFFTTSSETPEEVGMSSVWLDNAANTYLNSFCFGYRPTKNLDPYYLGFMLRSPKVRKSFILLAQGISRYNISKTKAMDIEVPIPTDNEQLKVGAFLKNLDHLITLHQRKLEKLKNIKKSLLERMFI